MPFLFATLVYEILGHLPYFFFFFSELDIRREDGKTEYNYRNGTA